MFLDILGLIVIGLVIGALARLILPGKQNISIVATLVLGVLGALIGGFIASLLGTGDIFELNILGFVLAVVAALVLVGGYAGTAGRSNRSVRH
ncbi:GlsB/YeaQ/YmgE family stress response membrane protein [Blastococcus saxobsidens]|uniref:GlsB/YeaQ/YmgE family stress response membrane protein n=1 Tax=Blastococcus saxobsidens TaxID=138336 RepID=UPI0031F3050E